MPIYKYRCDGCDLVFEEFHSMSETLEKCIKCDSSVKRVPATTFNIRKNANFGKQKPGNLVKEYIKDVVEEVKQEKKRLNSAEYERK